MLELLGKIDHQISVAVQLFRSGLAVSVILSKVVERRALCGSVFFLSGGSQACGRSCAGPFCKGSSVLSKVASQWQE